MAQLIVRDLDERVVAALKARAARNGRSAEAEHRRLLEAELVPDSSDTEEFARIAARLRARLQSNLDSTDLVRAARDARPG